MPHHRVGCSSVHPKIAHSRRRIGSGCTNRYSAAQHHHRAANNVHNANRTLSTILQQSLSTHNAIWIPHHTAQLPLAFACPWGGILLAVPPSDAPPRGPDQTADLDHTLATILQQPHHAIDLAAAWRARVLACRCGHALAAAAAPPAAPPPCHPARPPPGKPPWVPVGLCTRRVDCTVPAANMAPLPTLAAAAVDALSVALAVLLADLVRLLTTQHAGHARLVTQLWNLQARVHALQHGLY